MSLPGLILSAEILCSIYRSDMLSDRPFLCFPSDMKRNSSVGRVMMAQVTCSKPPNGPANPTYMFFPHVSTRLLCPFLCLLFCFQSHPDFIPRSSICMYPCTRPFLSFAWRRELVLCPCTHGPSLLCPLCNRRSLVLPLSFTCPHLPLTTFTS